MASYMGNSARPGATETDRKLLMKVLRGEDLVAMDYYGGAMASKSDPYCVIEVEGKEVARTTTISGTCSPVWEKPEWVEILTDGRVTIKIWDWDITSEDDPMGEVSFVVRDIEMHHRLPTYSVTEWFKVLPSGDSPASGKLQLLLCFESELAPKPTQWMEPRQLPKCLRSKIVEVSKARAPVFLHYYDLGHSSFFSNFNAMCPYGAFHAGLEVYGTEFSFGGTKKDVTGIFVCRPKRCTMHTYRASVYLGDCGLRKKQVETLLRKLKPLWRGPDYDIFRKNCCFFCRQLAIDLGLGEIPQWIYKLARLGSTLADALSPDLKLTEDDLLEAEASPGKKIDINAVLIEHIMAHRMQAAFRARRARKAGGPESPAHKKHPVVHHFV